MRFSKYLGFLIFKFQNLKKSKKITLIITKPIGFAFITQRTHIWTYFKSFLYSWVCLISLNLDRIQPRFLWSMVAVSVQIKTRNTFLKEKNVYFLIATQKLLYYLKKFFFIFVVYNILHIPLTLSLSHIVCLCFFNETIIITFYHLSFCEIYKWTLHCRPNKHR